MSNSDLVDIGHDGIATETSDAVKFWQGKNLWSRTAFWVPKSLIDAHDDKQVTVPEWFAIREGLV